MADKSAENATETLVDPSLVSVIGFASTEKQDCEISRNYF